MLDWLNIAGQLYSHTKNSQEVFSNLGYLEQIKEQDKSGEYLLNQKEEDNNLINFLGLITEVKEV